MSSGRQSEFSTNIFSHSSLLLSLLKLREGVKVEKKSAIIIALFLRGGGGAEVTIALLILILK